MFNNTYCIVPFIKHIPTRAEQNCTFYEGIYYTGNYLEKGLEGSVPNLNQWSSLEGGVFSLMADSQTTGTCPHLDWMSSTCPSRSSSTLPTCPVPGRLPVTMGNRAHWFLGAAGREGGERGQGIYLLPSHDVPSPLFLSGVLPTQLSSSLFVLGLMVSPLSSGCG